MTTLCIDFYESYLSTVFSIVTFLHYSQKISRHCLKSTDRLTVQVAEFESIEPLHSVHHNFTRDGKRVKGGGGLHPHRALTPACSA